MRIAALLLVTIAIGCGGNGAAPPAPAVVEDTAPIDSFVAETSAVVEDTAPVVDAPKPPLGWTSVEVTKTTEKAIVEKVHYKSGALDILGQVCRPKAAGKHKVVVVTHGGFEGIGSEWNGPGCVGFAEYGYAVVMSSYRGEDGSQGKIEVCLGEVDDVLAMTDIALAQPWADKDHVAVYGGSHGGCIAVRAIQRGLPARVLVDIFGVTDWANEWAYWTAERPKVTPDRQKVYDTLFSVMTTATGGTPSSHASEYAKRSPMSYVAALESFKGDLFIIHGTDDELVQVTDSCRLAEGLTAITPFHLDASGAVITTKPKGCESSKLTWVSDPKPTAWPGRRYVVIRDAAGHGGWVPATGIAADAIAFLASKL